MKKVVDIKNNPSPGPSSRVYYRELEVFKKEKELNGVSIENKPYTKEKKTVRVYRIIFYAISVLYLMLVVALYYNSFNWTINLFVENSLNIKTLLYFICSAVSVFSFCMAYAMNVEKEALRRAFKRARSRLKTAYRHKALNFNLKSVFSFSFYFRTWVIYRGHYKELLRMLVDYRDETSFLIDAINSSLNLEEGRREILFNQALKEFLGRAENLLSSLDIPFSKKAGNRSA